MSVVGAVRQRLLAINAVTTLVGQRVYALVLAQGSPLPAIRLQQVGDVTFMHLRGNDRVVRARVQVDSIATTYSSAHAVAMAAKGSFSGGSATGLMGWRGTANGVEVVAILPDGSREIFDAEELQQVKVTSDYLVWFLE